MTCALAPPNPKEFTPAIRPPFVSGNGSTASGTRSFSACEVDVRIWRCEMQARRDLPVLEHEHRFDQPGNAGGGFQMPEIGLHRPDRQRRLRRAIGAQRVGQRVRLDRIAHRRAGAMRFDESDLRRIDAGVAHTRRARAAPAPPGSGARCRWCGRPG